MLKRLRLSDRHRYTAVLAIIACVILTIGLLLKPPQSKQQDPLAITRSELENLQQLVRRNNLRNLSSSFSNVATQAGEHLTAFASPPAMRGVSISGLGIVAAKPLDSLPRPITVAQGAAPVSTVWTPGLPFLVVQTSEIFPATPAETSPSQGSWVVAVSASTSGEPMFSPGMYNGIVDATCGEFIRRRILTTIPLTASQTGAGLFDLAGDLHGVVLPCEDGVAIIPLSEIRRSWKSADPQTVTLLQRYGLRFEQPSQDSGGLVVSEVWSAWPADVAGLQPGDTVTAIDDDAVTAGVSPSQLVENNQAPHELRILRGGRRRVVLLQPFSSIGPENTPAVIAQGPSGITISHVSPGCSADRAGLKSSDEILYLNGRPATSQSIARAFQQFQLEEPVSVVVRRPGRLALIRVR